MFCAVCSWYSTLRDWYTLAHSSTAIKPLKSHSYIVSSYMSALYLDNLVAFFKRCKTGLQPGGMIFVKENVTKKKSSADDVDHSVTR